MQRYNCPECGELLSFNGLCLNCQQAQKRKECESWDEATCNAKESQLEQHLQEVSTAVYPFYEEFQHLLACHNRISAKMQAKALQERIYAPCELYYHAAPDIRDGLIQALLETQDPNAANSLMLCLAMQGDDQALATLLELEKHPRPWSKELFVGPSVYAQAGGWTFDERRQRIELNFEQCFSLIKPQKHQSQRPHQTPSLSPTPNSSPALPSQTTIDSDNAGSGNATSVNTDSGNEDNVLKVVLSPEQIASPIKTCVLKDECCPLCGGQMVDMLVMDGRDPRLSGFGINGILTATCCPNCIAFNDGPFFCHYDLQGGSTCLPAELAIPVDPVLEAEDYHCMAENSLILDPKPRPVFYGAFDEGLSTLGGFANWVDDWTYATCPKCGRPMKYLAQLQWSMIEGSGCEGTLYIEFCPECQITGMFHQQS